MPHLGHTRERRPESRQQEGGRLDSLPCANLTECFSSRPASAVCRILSSQFRKEPLHIVIAGNSRTERATDMVAVRMEKLTTMPAGPVCIVGVKCSEGVGSKSHQ